MGAMTVVDALGEFDVMVKVKFVVVFNGLFVIPGWGSVAVDIGVVHLDMVWPSGSDYAISK